MIFFSMIVFQNIIKKGKITQFSEKIMNFMSLHARDILIISRKNTEVKSSLIMAAATAITIFRIATSI